MSGLMGQPVNAVESLFGVLGGHPMPGFQYVDDNGEVVETFTFPTQEEINEQDTPFLKACLALHNKIKLFGLPHAKGYLNERPTVLRIYELCESAINGYESWRMKQGKNLEDRE